MRTTTHTLASRDARLPLVLLLVAGMLLISPALAIAAPANDNRANAQPIGLGETVNGTTVEATVEPDEGSCAGPGPSVWYAVEGTRDGRVISFLQANGDLDVALAVYSRQRSQISALSCDQSDPRGRASVEFEMARGQSYLLQVVQRPGSVAGDFALTVDLGRPPAQPPGRPLPEGGATGTVQRIFEPSDAWSTHLRAGRTYRVNLSSGSCIRLSIYGPGATSFNGPPLRSPDCGGYVLFTPGPGLSGRYSFLVQPGFERAPQSYRLQVGRAGADDTTPGRSLGNYSPVQGELDSRRLDVLDLYRFDVARRSLTDIALRTDSGGNFDLFVVTARGKRLKCACGPGADERVHVRTPRGRYYVAVRAQQQASGSYRIGRASKTITRTRIGVRPRRAGPGEPISLHVRVAPGAQGPVTILVERFDPLSGYQFVRQLETRSADGRATLTFEPPSLGRYRARAIFDGTRIAAGSSSRWRRFRVVAPLAERRLQRLGPLLREGRVV